MIFKKSRDKKLWDKSLEKLTRGEMSIEEFIKLNSKMTLYYSTPFGEDKSGNMRPWVLAEKPSDDIFFPAFINKKSCFEFLSAMGRKKFMVIEGDLQHALESLNSHPAFEKFGLVIDPNSNITVKINAKDRKK